MKTCAIFLLVVALSLLATVNAVRDTQVQEQLNLWSEKLVGKELLTEETANFDEATQFRASDLPTPNRILPPGAKMTMDFVPNRLNVYINSDNVVTKIRFA